MNKEQYAEMLKDISETNKIGGSVSACIEHLTFVDPSLPDAFAKSITSDIVALDQREDRIVLEVQHVDDDSFKGRLVYYTSKHVIASRVKGDNYNLRNLNLVSLQMFDGFPDSNKYRHCIRFKNEENEVFYDKETITLVEIPKFLKNKYEADNSRLAQWLRVFDGINNESPVPVPEGSHFALLQEKAKSEALKKWHLTCLPITSLSRKSSSTRTFPWKRCLNCAIHRLLLTQRNSGDYLSPPTSFRPSSRNFLTCLSFWRPLGLIESIMFMATIGPLHSPPG